MPMGMVWVWSCSPNRGIVVYGLTAYARKLASGPQPGRGKEDGRERERGGAVVIVAAAFCLFVCFVFLYC